MSWESAPVMGDVQVVGWALVHSLWQVALVAVVLAVLLRLARGREPELRYGLAAAALVVAVALPLITGGRMVAEWREHQACWALAESGATYHQLGEAGCLGHGVSNLVASPDDPPAAAAAMASHSPTLGMRLRHASADHGRLLTLPAALWLAAVLLLGVHTLRAWRRTRALRTREVRPAPARLHRLVSELGRELGLRRPVDLRSSPLVDVPTVLGWRRPVLLLPSGIADALREVELRTVLAHELAHIRRNDYPTNLIQTAIDTLLFFNPAARWISERVREERECCCDAIAANATGQVTVYMRALLELEGFRGGRRYRHAMALNHGSLLRRVRRLAASGEGRLRSGLSRTGRVLIVGAAILALVATVALSREPADIGAWGIMTQDIDRRDARMAEAAPGAADDAGATPAAPAVAISTTPSAPDP